MECSLRNGALRRSLLLAACLAAPGAAFAADNGFYLGLAASDVSSDYAAASASGADDDSGLKAIVGFRPLDSFAIEANYVDMGETRVPISFSPSTLSIDSEAFSVSAVGLLPLPLVDLYGRLGVARWESELSLLGASQKNTGTDPTYGAGAQFRVGSVALRLEYERFDFDDDSADLVSVGFTYTFL